MKQLDLFRKPRRPAVPKPRTLHVVDAGLPGPGKRHPRIQLECEVCGHETGWVAGRAVAIEQKGRVCPKCKGDPANVKPSAAKEAASAS
ncbi:hypothetical protein [Azospirillum agricola]|uniref:hypothetical protein n=1 Tax=Azospirillum agricola TaxID=1720247 RepID=UPI000A0F3FF9|nr:hypothetical protein [Azospirillum agricola]SMH62553.1 hypothetical protein SAMN02982994_6356 [Azospirillum lipoferum]